MVSNFVIVRLRFDEIRNIINVMKNHKKIKDMSKILTGK